MAADPNFGRVLQAAGMAYPSGDGFPATSRSRGGRSSRQAWRSSTTSASSSGLVAGDEVEYRLTLPGEAGRPRSTSPISRPDYVALQLGVHLVAMRDVATLLEALP